MMQRCHGSHNQGQVRGPCSCGTIHHHTPTTNSFSMLFSKSYADSTDMNMAAPSSVDCTLSLGTPSTRLSSQQHHYDKHNNNNLHDHRSVSNFCWDLLQQSKHVHNSPQYSPHPTHPTTTNTNLNNHDPLLARRCANCDTTSTPLWRNGPRGPKSLCNACGIRFKKEERRAGAVAATKAAAETSGGVMETAARMFSNGNNNGAWYGHSHHNEFRFVDDGGDREAIPFLSWRINVTDRPSLVHDFTR